MEFKRTFESRFAATLFAGLTLVAGLPAEAARAQLPDLFELRAQYMPPVPLRDVQPAEVQVATYDASLNVPIVLSDRSFLIPGLAYHGDASAFSQGPASLSELRGLHSLEATLLFVQLLPADWALSFRVAPGLAGDLKGLDSGMLRMSALAMVTKVVSDKLVLGGGALANYAFGTFLPLPAVYLDWTPAGRLRFETFLPAFANLTYTFGDRVEVGVRAEVSGSAYAIRGPSTTDTWPCAPAPEDDPGTEADERVADRSRCFDNVAYSVVSAGPRVSVRLLSSVWLTGFGGHTLFRRFEQMNADGERIPGGVEDLPGTWFFATALTMRLPDG